jgi:hypothetical protein
MSGVRLSWVVDDIARAPNGQGKVSKLLSLERRVHADLAAVSAGFEVRHSRWSQGRGAQQAVVLIREAPEEHMLPAIKGAATKLACLPGAGESDGWRTIHFESDAKTARGIKCRMIDSSERSKSWCGARPVKGELTHAYLADLLGPERCSAGAIRAVEDASPAFCESVHFLLNAIRPLSFD